MADVAPLRILHVTPYYEPAWIYGGPTRSLPLLCRALVRGGAQVTVATTDANGAARLDVPSGAPVNRGGVEVYYFRRRWPRSFFSAPALGRFCDAAAGAYDLVHATGLWTYPSLQASVCGRRHAKPVVISPRGMLMPWEFGHKAWKKRPQFYLSELRRLRRSAGIHCTTEEEKQALARFGLASAAFIVPNGLDSAEFDRLPHRDLLRQRLGIARDSTVLLYLGRLHPKKGIDVLLASFQRLQRDVRDLHLVLVGPDDGEYSRAVPAWAAERGLTGRIHLTGVLAGEQRLAAFAAADLFLLLSESENFGMGVAEAMACGLPVVVSGEVGISLWVERHNAGLVVARDPEQVARAIRPLLSQPDRMRAMGDNGRALVGSTFAIDAVGRQMLEVYREICARSAAKPVPRW